MHTKGLVIKIQRYMIDIRYIYKNISFNKHKYRTHCLTTEADKVKLEKQHTLGRFHLRRVFLIYRHGEFQSRDHM